MLAASALASVVLPVPGTSSISRCPSENRQIRHSRIASDLPTSTCPMLATSELNRSANRLASSSLSGCGAAGPFGRLHRTARAGQPAVHSAAAPAMPRSVRWVGRPAPRPTSTTAPTRAARRCRTAGSRRRWTTGSVRPGREHATGRSGSRRCRDTGCSSCPLGFRRRPVSIWAGSGSGVQRDRPVVPAVDAAQPVLAGRRRGGGLGRVGAAAGRAADVDLVAVVDPGPPAASQAALVRTQSPPPVPVSAAHPAHRVRRGDGVLVRRLDRAGTRLAGTRPVRTRTSDA